LARGTNIHRSVDIRVPGGSLLEFTEIEGPEKTSYFEWAAAIGRLFNDRSGHVTSARLKEISPE